MKYLNDFYESWARISVIKNTVFSFSGLLLLMNVTNEVAFTTVVSVLGYCLLPIVGLAALGVGFSLQGWLGTAAAAAAVCWCSYSASKLFVTAFNMQHQQLLVAYPCSMLYAVFALITVF